MVRCGPFGLSHFCSKTRLSVDFWTALLPGFAVRDGDLMWGESDLRFPIADLYETRFESLELN